MKFVTILALPAVLAISAEAATLPNETLTAVERQWWRRFTGNNGNNNNNNRPRFDWSNFGRNRGTTPAPATVPPPTPAPPGPGPVVTPAPATTTTRAPAPVTTPAPATTTTRAPDPGPPGCEGLSSQRPHLATISAGEWDRFQRGVLALQANGVYQRYVSIHSANSNTAHRGANFLVWHRAYLWELEKELEAVVPGARIPWYDWSSVANPLTNNVWSSNRMGSCNTNGRGGIRDGPFAGMDSQLSRGGDTSVSIPSRQSIVDALDTGLGYAAFNNWLEVAHGSFHVAVGGSMGSIGSAPRDPVFFTHHAYIDAIYREWQNRGGGNQFAGTHGGSDVSARSVMQPFGRRAGGILAGISQCVQYVGGGRTISRQVMLNTVSVTDGAISGGDGSIIPRIRKSTKKALQLLVARRKANNPSAYIAELRVAVERKNSMKRAAFKFGLLAANIDAYERTQALIDLKKGVDISEPEIIEEAPAAVELEGQQEVAALESGLNSGLKAKKFVEAALDTVATF